MENVPVVTRLARRLQRIPSSATVAIADLATSLRRQGQHVIDLSAGRAAEHTPSYIREAAIAALAGGDTHQTPAKGTVAYRRACAAKLQRDNGIEADPETEIIATLGVKQGLLLSLFASIDPGDEVIVEDPCFVSYQPLIELAGGTPVAVQLRPEQGYRWTFDQLAAAVTGRTRAILFNSPHNPTGIVHAESDLDVVCRVAAERNLIVITDEVYERVAWSGHRHVSLATRPGMRDRAITVMGLTKTFSMGGWRIGLVFAAPERIAAMTVLQQHLITCPSSFAQAGGAAALREPPRSEVLSLWQDWERRCVFVNEQLAAIPGVTCRAPEGGFYAWVNVSGRGWTSETFARRLLQRYHVAVVPGSAFGPSGEGYVRVTCVRSWDELRVAVDLMRRAIEVEAPESATAAPA